MGSDAAVSIGHCGVCCDKGKRAAAAGIRDLKPGNIIVTRLGGQSDVAKLLDFGLVQDLASATDERLTQQGIILGTPACMSPEQAAGQFVLDARGDIYSLGAVAYFALTGRPPFQEVSIGQLLAAHRDQIPRSLTDIRPDLPPDLSATVARCLSKNPADRFQTIDEVRQSLELCLHFASGSDATCMEAWPGAPLCDVAH